jgi:hypothetical protein
MTVRAPEDLIAFAPIAAGFRPADSVVMLSLRSPGGGPHARVGLPAGPQDVGELADVLVSAARRNDVAVVAFLVYGEDSPLVRAVADTLDREFTAAGVEVYDILRVEKDCWFPLVPGHPVDALAGVPYDVSTHPFTLEAILRGRVVRGGRDEVEALVRPAPGAGLLPERLLDRAVPLGKGRVTEVVQRHLDARTRLSDAELAAVAVSVVDPSMRDECWSWLDRSSARDAVDLWTDAVGRLPDEWVGDVAAVLALVAWLSGDGALAWCAVDRCLDVQDHNSLASLVAQLLHGSVSPDVWERPDGQLGGPPPAA